MPIDRGPFNLLQDDDGSNLVGSVWNKAAIKTVILDPADAAIPVIATGTWTPSDASGAGLVLTSQYPCRYWKIDKHVSIVGTVTFPVTANAAQATIGGLPFACGGTPGGLYLTYAGSTGLMRINASTTAIVFWTNVGDPRPNSSLSGAVVYFTGMYLTA